MKITDEEIRKELNLIDLEELLERNESQGFIYYEDLIRVIPEFKTEEEIDTVIQFVEGLDVIVERSECPWVTENPVLDD